MVFRSKIVFTIILLGVLSLGFYAYNWQSPDVNQSASSNIHQCIYKSKNKRNLKVKSLNNEFAITNVENSDHDCFNPRFPAIHITTQAKHSAWLYVVHTDSNDIKDNQIFVDTVDPDKAPDIYPFYNLGQEFYDIAFRKKLYSSLDELQTEVNEWPKKYNEVRPHSGRYCYGKTPMQTFLEGKAIAKEKQLDNLHQWDDNKIELAKAEDASQEASEHLGAVAPSDEMISALNYQGANQSEAEKNLYLTDNRTAR